MKVCIIGAGAVGRFLAGTLGEICDVTLVSRRTEANAEVSISVTGSIESCAKVVLSAYPVAADLTCVATKATCLQEVITSGLHSPAAAFFQNGMGINNIVRTLSPAKMLLRAYLWAGLTVTDGWSVRCNGFSEIVVSSLTVDSQTGILGDLLQRANLTQRCSADPDGIEWEKGLLNVAINGLCGILGFTRNGQLLESKHLQALVRGVIRETQGIASFYGVKLDHEDCTLERIMISGNNTNSLVMDLRRGLLTEVEYLNGFVVRSAKESGVGSPYNTFIYHLVKHLETYGSSQAVPDEY